MQATDIEYPCDFIGRYLKVNFSTSRLRFDMHKSLVRSTLSSKSLEMYVRGAQTILL